MTDTRAIPPSAVPGWDHEADVVVVGHGGAGASAAIEAAGAHLKVVGSRYTEQLERAAGLEGIGINLNG